MTSSITAAQATAALEAVKAQFAEYLKPLVLEADEDGPAITYPGSPEPTLVEDYSREGVWAICWEEGPDEWAYRATMGGTSEEERVLAAQAAVEFGVDPSTTAPKADEPVTFPKGVYAEPYMSFVLALYPDA